MAFPVGMSTCLVTFGRDLTFGGDDTTVSVKIEPFIDGSANHLVWAATGESLDAFAFTEAGAPGEPVTIALPHTNQAGFVNPNQEPFTGFGYTATITAVNAAGKKIERVKSLQPLVGQATIDADLVADGSFTAPVVGPPAVVTDIAGETGSISASELAALVPDNSLVNSIIFGS